jgi:hypothetical protein
MSIKKSMLAGAVTALALMGLASSATASGGVVRHVVSPNGIVPSGTKTHYAGWAKFASGSGSYQCHVTSASEATGIAGNTALVTQFTVPDTTKCTGGGFASGCQLETHSTTAGGKIVSATNPLHITATPTDFDVTDPSGGKIVLHNKYKGFCLLSGSEVTLTFSSITLKPLETGTPDPVTGTAGRLDQGNTAETGDPIVGVEIEGTGELHRPGVVGEHVVASGELEITDVNRCTWKLVTS